MSNATDRKSRKDRPERLSAQLKASDFFPPGAGWNRGADAAPAPRHDVERPAGAPAPAFRQH